MKTANDISRVWRRYFIRSVPAILAWSIVLLAAGASALAQRPLIYEHVEELSRYLNGVKIAEPVVFDRMAVYPVLVNSPLLLSGQWLTLDEALASGALTIMQRGTRSKPGLWVENSSLDEHVFLMKDETIEQNSQTRMVRRDTVLAPGERVELNVLGLQVPPTAGGKHLSTDERLEQLCREIVLRIPRGTTGFIFLCDGRSLGPDFFGSEDLALKLLPKLLKSYTPGPTSLPNTADYRGNSRNDAEAIEFFGRICGAHSEVSGTTGSGVGLRTNDRNLRGGGVVLDGLVVHYGIRAEALGTPYRRPRPSIIWPSPSVVQSRIIIDCCRFAN